MFRFLILSLACLPLHHAMAQMPGAVPGGWNGSVALPHAPMAPSVLSMPAAPPLAHFAPLHASGTSVPSSPYREQVPGPADLNATQPAAPMPGSPARQDWTAFRRAEQQALRNTHSPAAP
ncbi:hypothetical protein LU298_04955 [Komagataeibacter intermedius]|uniref:Uncharacterized protein n=2 Tax=Komagataeibacter intermedius TaxID=66229 RepID=A0A0N0MDR1_9PROT|nr:hypothetical protein [Komagataeibacter intermedius]KPH85573.1 hypothetical protein GLUCOINTEAF2_0203342 [Komagataeibacter intermedius AF2]MCF3635848.1 hypothetical protein [Komagataeibacter intermedius]GAN86265.1 hypothetical protein Gain_0024_032 [Komagataeibacter intermedius TF2]GBQ76732.1 hypothetical protein AA0521_2952 [Komagataeibacter intermedius NRIC 0521]